MSYTFIQKDDKQIGFKFNQMAVEVYSKYLDLEAIESSSMYATFYAGIVGNAYVKREEPALTFEQVIDWVDELLNEGKTELIQQVNDVFAETQAFKKYITRLQKALENNESESEDVKKKKE